MQKPLYHSLVPLSALSCGYALVSNFIFLLMHAIWRINSSVTIIEITGLKNVSYVCSFQIPGVPEDTQFAPRTQREIRDIQWFPIAGLPNSKKEEITDDPVLNPFNVSFNNLFMVMPFVSGIRRWISKKFNPGGRNGRKESSKNSIRFDH